MFFPFLRIYKERVQQVWGGVEESIALGGKDDVEGEKARVFRFTFPITPHPPPAASYLLPVLPPKVLTARPLAASVFIDQSSFCFLLLLKILYCCPAKEQLQGKSIRLRSGMVQRPCGCNCVTPNSAFITRSHTRSHYFKHYCKTVHFTKIC